MKNTKGIKKVIPKIKVIDMIGFTREDFYKMSHEERQR